MALPLLLLLLLPLGLPLPSFDAIASLFSNRLILRIVES
jgi:hypothetical protein